MLAGQALAKDFDFSAVCSSGQTLYYEITSDKEPYTVIVTYPDNSENVVFYIDYPAPDGNLVIPTEVENEGVNYRVTKISERAFCGCRGLTSVTIPESVTSIANYTFYGCGLTSIKIPNSVISIGGWAFTNCSGLTAIDVPNSVTSIGDCAFAGCSGLLSVTIPKTVKKIGNLAFVKCTATIYCEVENKPDEWDKDWLDYEEYKGKVVWGYKPTAVVESVANSVNIYTHGNTIVVENAAEEISVYNAMGNLVCRYAIHRIREEITINIPGVYIVKTGDTVKRVLVK